MNKDIFVHQQNGMEYNIAMKKGEYQNNYGFVTSNKSLNHVYLQCSYL